MTSPVGDSPIGDWPIGGWPVGAATGVGSLPGTDIREGTRLVFGELPDLPHLPELPARGPGADMVGRAAAILVDLPMEYVAGSWRLTDRAGGDVRRAQSWLSEDLDALEEMAQGYAGVLKVQMVGPWTLAASTETRTGHRAVSDPGLVRELAASLGEGLATHVAQIRRRIPGISLVVQLDEPSLPAVLEGSISTPSGLGRVRSVEPPVAQQLLGEVIAATGEGVLPAVHCCARRPPVSLFRRAGARALSLDLTVIGEELDDELGEAVEAGTQLLAGVVPAVPGQVLSDAVLSDPATTVGPVRALWHRLGLPAEDLARRVSVTPTCGLAGADDAFVRRALKSSRDAARLLVEDPEFRGRPGAEAAR